MNRKSIKYVIIFLVILLLFIGYCAILGYSIFSIRDYQERYREWDTKEGILELEFVFDFNFPEDIREVKVAKTPVIDFSSISFVVKFFAKADTVDSFIETFPPQFPSEPWLKIEFEPYKRELDRRNPPRFEPAWFKEPIQQGKIGRYAKGGKIRIYIDTTDKNNYVVYLDGSYSTVYREQKRRQSDKR